MVGRGKKDDEGGKSSPHTLFSSVPSNKYTRKKVFPSQGESESGESIAIAIHKIQCSKITEVDRCRAQGVE